MIWRRTTWADARRVIAEDSSFRRASGEFTSGLSSRFRLVDQFGFAFRNVPEPIQAILNDGRVLTPTRGNIEYHFKAFGSIAVLFYTSQAQNW